MWLANSLTLSRIPLGVLFALFARNTPVALALLLVGGATDIADGMVARRCVAPGSKAATLGTWLDPACDKIFLGCVLFGIYLRSELHINVVALVLVREILQVIALSVMAARRIRPAAEDTHYDFRATRTGKATTVIQFAFAATALLRLPASISITLAGLAAGLGATSVWLYIRRYFLD